MEPIQVALPDLVLTNIGDQLLLFGDRKTVKILAGISRQYRRIFAPLLFSKIVVTRLRSQMLAKGELDEPPYLSFVKHFRYTVDDMVEPNDDEFDRPHLVMNILPQMHSIITFDWGLLGYAAGGVNLPLDILKMLQQECPKLRHLSLSLGRLHYHNEIDHSIADKFGNHVRYGWRNELQVPLFDIRGFRNLATLDVLEIYGNLKTQARNLGVVLAENPQLRRLSLSIQASAIPQDGDELWELDEPEADHNMFFTWLCDEFSDRRKQAPLSLRRIYLGKPMTFNAADFARLTKGHLLEQLFQYAGPANEGLFPFGIVEPDLMVFSYETCPALWEVSVPEPGAENFLRPLLGSWPKIDVECSLSSGIELRFHESGAI